MVYLIINTINNGILILLCTKSKKMILALII